MVEIEWEQYFEYHHRIISEKIVRALDTGQLMGDTGQLMGDTGQLMGDAIAAP